MGNVTIRDVAQRAGVSRSSASAVLSGGRRDLFRAATVEKVYAAARELGYQAHAGARLLRQGQSTLIGLAVRTDILDWHSINSLLTAAHAELVRRGWQPVIVDPEQMVPDKSFAPFPSPEMLAGLISIDMAMENHVPSFYKVLGARLPIVALYPMLREAAVDCVTTDRAAGIEMAFDHLWELGHRRIGFIEVHPWESLTSREKLTGWKRVLRRRNLKPQEAHFFPADALLTPKERSDRVAKTLLGMSERERPTALICSGDEIALRVLHLWSEAGRRVPDELSLVGFDDVKHAEYSVPALTTVAQPVEAIARAAVERLSTLIELAGQEKTWQPQHRLIAPQLVVRKTTRRR
jgi:DNA-binding LacI/PurR family transcriptional regulator